MSKPNRSTHLLLDSRLIESADNALLSPGQVEKHPANPLLQADQPWETDLSHMYPNVVFDPVEQRYKLWYYTRIKEWQEHIEPGPLSNREAPRGNKATLYAVSEDGVHWEKPALDFYHYQGQPTNIVIYGDHGTGVFRDPTDPDPSRRYKMITARAPHKRIDVAFSEDGVRWSERTYVADAQGDTHNNALWAPDLKGYVAFTRGYADETRRVLRMESQDFIEWTQPEEVLSGTREAQVYSMPVFFHAGIYLGLPAIFMTGTTGRVHTELAWSPDTVQWHRLGEGAQMIPLSEDPESFEWGCIYAAATPVILDDETRLYYSGQPDKHGWNPGHFCLAILRPDRWAGYEPRDRDRPAMIQTSPVTCSGNRLLLNVDADGGQVIVTILDARGKILARSKPLTNDLTAAPAEWENDINLSEYAGQPIRLQCEIRNATVFAFTFGN